MGVSSPDEATAADAVRGVDRRWRSLARLVDAALPSMLRDVRDVLAVDHSDYAAFLDMAFEEIHTGARRFAPRLTGLADPGAGGLEPVLFEGIGRDHHRHGLDVTGLLAAYRTGALVAWRHVAAAADACGMSGPVLAMLAASVFRALDELSAASLRGYLDEASDHARTREAGRRELAELILAGRDRAAVTVAARRVGWRLPGRAALALTGPDTELSEPTVSRLGPDCLRLRRPEMGITIVPDPDGPTRPDRMSTALAGTDAVIGATADLEHLAATLQPAALALRLHRTGAALPGGPIAVSEHLDTLLVHHDRHLLTALRAHHLAPLAGLPGPARDRLTATLSSWLRHMGNHQAIAAELHIHPQTVRYRLHQLHELYGAALHDPATRAGLTLALAWPDNPPSDTVTDRTPPSTPPRAPAPPPVPGSGHAASSSTGRTSRAGWWTGAVSRAGRCCSVPRPGRAARSWAGTACSSRAHRGGPISRHGSSPRWASFPTISQC